MIKKLSKHGNSQALVLDRAVLDLLNIDDKTPLKISTDGESIIVTPIHSEDSRRRKLQESIADSNVRYDKT